MIRSRRRPEGSWAEAGSWLHRDRSSESNGKLGPGSRFGCRREGERGCAAGSFRPETGTRTVAFALTRELEVSSFAGAKCMEPVGDGQTAVAKTELGSKGSGMTEAGTVHGLGSGPGAQQREKERARGRWGSAEKEPDLMLSCSGARTVGAVREWERAGVSGGFECPHLPVLIASHQVGFSLEVMGPNT